MTEHANEVAGLQTWWVEASFPGKECVELKPDGTLVLRPAGREKERVLVVLDPVRADDMIAVLAGRFQELDARARELQADWDQAEDKYKLASRVSRFREQLVHTAAVGDMHTLIGMLEAWERDLAVLAEQHAESRLALVRQAEALAGSEQWKEATQELKEITEKWKQAGSVSRTLNDELWARLEAARDKFFERKRRNQEAQEQEMLRNLDLKMELVEKAEKLAASEQWKDTTEQFHQLLDQWKATGRTLPDKNEALWQRFIEAKHVFFDRKKQHFEQIQQEQEVNYGIKQKLVDQAELLRESQDWSGTAQAFTDLMEQWKRTGRVAADKADELWGRFIAAKEQFFNARRAHFETVRNTLEENYQKKKELLARAEVLQQSSQWHAATDELNALMTEWKQTGPVPREHSEQIWKRFIAARTAFFSRKDEHREQRKQQVKRQQAERIQQAHRFLAQLEEELQEEDAKLEDFRNGLQNITSGPKEDELRSHLEKLVQQTTQRIQRKQEKIEEVRQQIEGLGQSAGEEARG